MNHTFVIRGPEFKKAAIEFISAMPLDPTPEIVVRDHEEIRTLAQNSLYWLWNTVVAGELGETKGEIHRRYKKKFLVHIFERDDPEYAKMIESVRAVHRAGMKGEAKSLSDNIVRLTSTRDAKVKQFTEYLNDIEKDAMEMGIILPHPEDRYNLAMGIK